MYKKTLKFILIILAIFTLTSCVVENNQGGENQETVFITNVTIDHTTVPFEVDVEDFDLYNIKLNVTKSNGEIEYITVDTSMLSHEDINSLKTPGTKSIEVIYEGFKVTFDIILTEPPIIVTPPVSKINIMAINDTHGALYTDGDNIGFEKVSSLVKSLETDKNKYIKIATGDIFQGTYISNINHGRPLIEVMNLMDFKALVIGNHEFDWGIDEIAKFADNNLENGEANFPFLASNIIDNKTGKTLPWTKDYVIVEQDGYRVGIIGAIGADLESSIAADKVAGYSFIDPLPIIKRLSQQLRIDLNCDLVIVAIHEYSYNTNHRIASLSGLTTVDAIICGHTHERVNEVITRDDRYLIPIIQSATKNYSVGTITFNFDEFQSLINAQSKYYEPASYQGDEEILNFFKGYQTQIDAGKKIITYTPEYLNQYRIGQEMTKAMKEAYDVDVAIINTGGVRGDIKAGNILLRQIYDVFPFDNKIVLTNMSGLDLRRLYDEHGSYLYFNNDFNFYNISNSKVYTVATIDYVFTNKYYKSMFANSVANNTTILMRDVFINYLENDDEILYGSK